MKFLRTTTLAAVGSVAMLVATQIGASASVNPYSGAGYDFSYVQCGAAAPSAQFGIVGVNAGYPFTYYNGCLTAEYNAAPAGHASLYVNTGYDASYTAIDGRHTEQDCATASSQVIATTAQQAAWAVGCSEAERDVAYAAGQGAVAPAAWWLDVETANSWCGQSGTSCTDLTLNQHAIQGLIDTFTHIGAVPVGIYSNRTQWSAIVGNLPIAGVTSNWVASGRYTAQEAATYCSSSASFSGAPVSLVQFLGGPVDRDYAC